MKSKNIVIIIGIVIFFVSATFYLSATMTTSQIKAEKYDPINTLYLPKNATEIKNHGNGWATFRLDGDKIVYFRHPMDHEIAIASLP